MSFGVTARRWSPGCDEAGCGPLAGPVVAAAVVFPCAWLEGGLYSKLRGLNDSKQLDEEQREKFYDIITTHPEIRYAIATVDVEMIDRINIRQAAWRGMNIALDHAGAQTTARADRWLEDQMAAISADCAWSTVTARVTRSLRPAYWPR